MALEQLYSVKDLMGILNRSQATIYRYLDSGMVPIVKIGNRVMVKESEIGKLMDVNTERRGCLKRNWRGKVVSG